MEKHLQTTGFRLKFLLEGLQCYKDTQMKAYDIIQEAQLSQIGRAMPRVVEYFG